MNADQALELVLDGTTDELDSGDETDIEHHFPCHITGHLTLVCSRSTLGT
jgi:hypothetical protein